MKYRPIRLILLLGCLTACCLAASGQPVDGKSGSSTNTPLQSLLSSAGLKVVSGQEPASQAPTNETAVVYSTQAAPDLTALLLTLAPTAKISERTEGDPNSIVCTWPDVAVRFTVQPHWDGDWQREAMKNWIGIVPGGDTNAPAVGTLFHQVDGTVACIGAVITPRHDPDGKASALVLGLAGKLDGYVFAQKAFYSPDGRKIIGVTNAPEAYAAQ